MSLAGSPIDECVQKCMINDGPSIDASRNGGDRKEKKEPGKKDQSHDGAQLSGQLARSF